ncbi:EAL domain-containing protein [Rheinheimera sp.]|uniref:EAL domain-containing protein n=1 Tax=Rheinheimera sp. TaxID=1869214 RepID=UPI00307CE11F
MPLTPPPDLTQLSSSQPLAELLSQQALVCCQPEQSVQQVACMMASRNISCVLVEEQHKIIGIWTESDSKRLLCSDSDNLDQPIRQVMSHPVMTISHMASAADATELMKGSGIRRLLVVDEQEQALGILTQTDLIRQQQLEHYLVLRDISSLLNEAPLVLQGHQSLSTAAYAMAESRTDAVLVQLETGEYGIVTERDLVRLIAAKRTRLNLEQVASFPLLTLPAHTSLMQAVQTLEHNGYRHLGVTSSSGQLCGLLSYSHLLLNMEHLYIRELRAALEAHNLALRSSAEHLKLAYQVIEASKDAIMITDRQGVIQSVNPAFCQLTGYSVSDALGKTPRLLSSGLHNSTFYQQMWQQLQQQGHWQGEIYNKRKNGEVYPEWLSISAIRSEDGMVSQYAAIFSDMTERKKREEKIHQLAFFDEMTGLANRRLFHDRLELSLANAKRHQHLLAVLFLDLDLFKRINDTLGHQAGDQVLIQVGKRLSQVVRTGESVARLGGDEFTLLMPECSSVQDTEHLARRIVQQFSLPFLIGDQELVLTTSIGIAFYPQDADSADELLRCADVAMYQAKSSGRNHYAFYHHSLGQRHREALELEQALRRAMAEQRLEVHYQPKIRLADGSTDSLEALVRWTDPQRGAVPPDLFIPVAENLGLIQQLGAYVLQQVCAQLTQWPKHCRVAVNISAKELSASSFLPMVRELLNRYGIRPGQLELEITESCLVPEQAEQTLRLLGALRQMGIRIAIDDFGTGYSSLSYLRHLPIDSIKIDRSFIRALPEDLNDCQITSAILAMAKALGLQVVAEGIETPQQLEFLLQAGCDLGQGYLFARPTPASQLEL